MLTTGGDHLNRDLSYPLTIEAFIADFFPIIASDGLPAFPHLSMGPTMVGSALIGGMARASTGTLLGLIVFVHALLAFAAAFWAFGYMANRKIASENSLLIGRVVAGITYAVNPWILGRIEHLGLAMGYAIFPAAMAMTLHAYRRGSARRAVLAGGIFAFVAASPHVLLASVVIVGSLVTTRLITLPNERRRTLALTTITVGATALFTSFAWIPIAASTIHAGSIPRALAAATGDIAVGNSTISWIDALTLSANPQWSTELGALGTGRLAWRIAGLMMAASMIFAAVWRPTRRGAIPLVVSAVTVMLFIGLTQHPESHGWLESAVGTFPGSRGLREPDKYSGLIALAIAASLGSIAMFLANRWANTKSLDRLTISILGGLLSITFVAWIIPAEKHFLWGHATGVWTPIHLDPGYRQGMDFIREEHPQPQRILIFEQDERRPYWDPDRVLRPLVTRSLSPLQVTGSRTISTVKPLALVQSLTETSLTAAISAYQADRTLVVTDTKEGQELRDRLADLEQFKLLYQNNVLAYFEFRHQPSPSGHNTPWASVTGIRGLATGNATSLVVDVAPNTCSRSSLSEVPPAAPGTDGRAVALACHPSESFVNIRTSANTSQDWEYADGTPSGFRRWLATLKVENLRVMDLDYGLGMSWIRRDERTVKSSPLLIRIPVEPTGHREIYARVLVGSNVAHLEMRLRGSSVSSNTLDISDTGPPRLVWVPVGSVTDPGNEPVTLEITTGHGFAAINTIAVSDQPLKPSRPGHSYPSYLGRYIPGSDGTTSHRHRVHVTQAPAIVTLGFPYDSGWVASTSLGSFSALPVGGGLSGFLIEDTDTVEIDVDYVFQPWYFAGIVVSVLALITAMIYLSWPLQQPIRNNLNRTRPPIFRSRNQY